MCILKLIICDVKSLDKAEFSEKQEHWKEIAHTKGFIFQCGGWNDNKAIILSFWENHQLIDNFMINHHDSIIAITQQNLLYSKIDIRYFNVHNISEILVPEIKNISFIKKKLYFDKTYLDSEIVTSNIGDCSFPLVPQWTVKGSTD